MQRGPGGVAKGLHGSQVGCRINKAMLADRRQVVQGRRVKHGESAAGMIGGLRASRCLGYAKLAYRGHVIAL